MTNSTSSLIHSRPLSLETIWLESEQIEQAKAMSGGAMLETQQWQSYLNTLALLGFQQWLNERLPEKTLNRLNESTEPTCYVEVDGFKFCLSAVEHVLDEIVYIPQAFVEQPAFAAHFYVVLEVSEEQELVTVRGFLRFDEMIHHRDRGSLLLQDRCYWLPLTLLDAEPNHLLFYCRALQPSAISLPLPAATPSTVDQLLVSLIHTTTKLTQWLQGTFDQNWQAIEHLIDPNAYLALSTRNLGTGIKRGKLINFRVQLGYQAVALLISITSEAGEKLGVMVQLHPTGTAQHLMANLKLSLRSQTGKTLQEVTSRIQDNYIQLKPFRGFPGTRFSVAIYLDGEMIEENFEL